MKKILLFSCLLFIFGCDEVLIEENRRIEIKGSVNSITNEPVPDLKIFAAGATEGNFSTNTNKLLGKGSSNENGDFDFISLDSYSHGLVIAINPSEIEVDSTYASLYFYDPSGEHSSAYDLQDISIPRKINFQLDIRNTSGTSDTLKYVLDFERPVLKYIYESGRFVENDSGGASYITIREHRPESDPLSLSLPIMEGSEFVFAYRLGDSPLEEIAIPVNTENNSYDFEY